MDPHGVIPLQPTYPNSTGGVTGGRTVYYDTEGKGNIFLSCHEMIRAYVFGDYYDEVDMSRSHISSVLGCWSLTGRPDPTTRTRMLSDQAELEADIALDLSLMRTSLEAELEDCIDAAGANPTPDQAKRVVYARKALSKCHMAPKQVFSAMINCRNPNSWRVPFPSTTCPTLATCLKDALLMRSSVLLHPLCTPLAQALTAAGTLEYRTISICLGHLDTQALQAARESLTVIDCPTGPTINDSLLISTRPPTQRPSILACITHAASTRLGYPVKFTYLPHLTKPDKPRPDLSSIATALHLAPPSPPSPPLSDSSSPDSSRETSHSLSPPLPRPTSPSDSNLSPTPPPCLISPDRVPLAHPLNPEPPSPLPACDDPDVMSHGCPLGPHSNPSPQPSLAVTPEPVCPPLPLGSLPPSPLQPNWLPRCSLCFEPLDPDDAYHSINFFRDACPRDHTLCANCATAYPHACTLDIHACVLLVCADPASLFPSPPPLAPPHPDRPRCTST